MYHRRLLLLLSLITIGMLFLSGQMTRLTVVQGAELRAEAESRLINERWTPTFRGQILDRKGRILALDRPSFDLVADYRLITGEWAYNRAAREARRQSRDVWTSLSPSERERRIQERLPKYLEQLEAVWSAVADVAQVDPGEVELRKNKIRSTVERMASSIWARRLERERRAAASREVLVELDDVARPIREQKSSHVIVRGLDDRRAFRLRALINTLGDLKRGDMEVIDAGQRAYPYETMTVAIDRSTFPGTLGTEEMINVEVDGVATHMLGWMRNRIYAEDRERRPRRDPVTGDVDRGFYREGDSVGAAGLEGSLEDRLRGLRGHVVKRLDTGATTTTESARGDDITLAIDIELQARLQALIDPDLGLTKVQPWHLHQDLALGHRLNSAVVVIEIDSGDILSMASHPTFTRRQIQDDPDSIFRDPVDQAWVNRPLQRPYQPGSIVKPLVHAEMISADPKALGRHITCNGHFIPGRPGIYRCWIYRPRYGMTTHSAQVDGALSVVEAIKRSCNIYFYTLGRALGIEGMVEMYRRYGVGVAYEIGLSGAAPGFLGRLDGAPFTNSEAIMMGIGQGPVSWTPLHAADAYATFVREGVRLPPRLVVDDTPRDPVDLNLHPRAVREGILGLDGAINREEGTAHHITHEDYSRERIFNVPGVRVRGKTGTAQAAPTFYDLKGDLSVSKDNPNIVRAGDHAWTVAIVGPEGKAPTHTIAVVVEHGGSGGRVAGPIVNQVVKALVDLGLLEATP